VGLNSRTASIQVTTSGLEIIKNNCKSFEWLLIVIIRAACVIYTFVSLLLVGSPVL
jgi:hypothetical protein